MGEFGSQREWSLREALEKRGKVLLFLATFFGMPNEKIEAIAQRYETSHPMEEMNDEDVSEFLAEHMDELIQESETETENIETEVISEKSEVSTEETEETVEPFVINLKAQPVEIVNEKDESGVAVEEHAARVQAAIERVIGEELPRVKSAAEGAEHDKRFFILSNDPEEGFIGRMDIQNGEQNFGSVYIGKDGTYTFWPHVGNNIKRISVENEGDLEELIQEYQDYHNVLVGAKEGNLDMAEKLEETLHFKDFLEDDV